MDEFDLPDQSSTASGSISAANAGRRDRTDVLVASLPDYAQRFVARHLPAVEFWGRASPTRSRLSIVEDFVAGVAEVVRSAGGND